MLLTHPILGLSKYKIGRRLENKKNIKAEACVACKKQQRQISSTQVRLISIYSMHKLKKASSPHAWILVSVHMTGKLVPRDHLRSHRLGSSRDAPKETKCFGQSNLRYSKHDNFTTQPFILQDSKRQILLTSVWISQVCS